MSIDGTSVGIHTCARATTAARGDDFGTPFEFTIETADELIAPHAVTRHVAAMADKTSLAMG
jgi:hypothetical protein